MLGGGDVMVPARPDDPLAREVVRGESEKLWLGVRDDFRNWLIREAA